MLQSSLTVRNFERLATKKLVGILAVGGLFTLELHWLASSRCEVPGRVRIEHDRAVPLSSGRAVGQIFRADADGLCRVRVLLFTPEGGPGADLEFHLQSVGRDGEEHAARRFKVSRSGWLEVEFPAIESSQGRDYHFYATARGTEKTVRIAAAEGNPYKDGKAYGQGFPPDLDLRFETYFERSGQERLGLLLFGSPALPGKPFLVIASFLTYNIVLAILIVRILPGLIHERMTDEP